MFYFNKNNQYLFNLPRYFGIMFLDAHDNSIGYGRH